MKLYLAEFNLDHTPYMGDRKQGQRQYRLVRADHKDDAHDKLIDALAPTGHHGDDSYDLRNIVITETIE